MHLYDEGEKEDELLQIVPHDHSAEESIMRGMAD
jgi:hypothetical protein